VKVEFSLKGIPEVEKALLDLEKKPAKKLLVQGMRAAMRPMKDAVKANVPVVSGDMQRAVKIRALPRSRTSFGVTVQIGEKDFVGKQYYSAMVEFGTSKQPPQGNLRKAFDETHDKAIKTFEDFMRQGLGL
jgi:HK97 gp10 family phage protein